MVLRLSRTPPDSDLLASSGASTFRATGKPVCSATNKASVASRATVVCVTGMPKLRSSALDSIADRVWRRWLSRVSISTRAPPVRRYAVALPPAVCSSRVWLWWKREMLWNSSIAASGELNTGSPAWASSVRASATWPPPIQQQHSLSRTWAARSMMSCATSTGSTSACGDRITSRLDTAASSASARMASR